MAEVGSNPAEPTVLSSFFLAVLIFAKHGKTRVNECGCFLFFKLQPVASFIASERFDQGYLLNIRHVFQPPLCFRFFFA
jgi:hypothetical protein